MSNDFSQYSPEQLEELARQMRDSAAGAQFDDQPLAPTPPASPQDPYAATVWGSNEYDFRVPSGQLCRMRKLRPEALVGSDLLDRITRLPAYAQEQIDKAEGKPPMPEMPSKDDMTSVMSVLDELLPMVVVKPVVHRTPADQADKEPGKVYVDDIDLVDRVAIMEQAMKGVKAMDNFRAEP